MYSITTVKGFGKAASLLNIHDHIGKSWIVPAIVYPTDGSLIGYGLLVLAVLLDSLIPGYLLQSKLVINISCKF